MEKEFYHPLITEKSFEVLQELRKEFDFILIGGWAVFLYAGALKSKDIDIVIDFGELGKFKQKFRVHKNERLKKYEAKIKKVDIDIYLPHFSQIGFPLEDLKKYTHSIKGFAVPIPEILLIFKARTFRSRKGTTKGRKDLIDIFSLISNDAVDWEKYRQLVKEYHLLEVTEILKEILQSQRRIPELGLLNHQTAKLRESVLKELR